MALSSHFSKNTNECTLSFAFFTFQMDERKLYEMQLQHATTDMWTIDSSGRLLDKVGENGMTNHGRILASTLLLGRMATKNGQSDEEDLAIFELRGNSARLVRKKSLYNGALKWNKKTGTPEPQRILCNPTRDSRPTNWKGCLFWILRGGCLRVFVLHTCFTLPPDVPWYSPCSRPSLSQSCTLMHSFLVQICALLHSF